MGAALAEAMLKAGHETIVYNRTRHKLEPLLALGAIAADSAAEAIAQADASLIALTDAACTEQVLLSNETALALGGRKLINVATISPDEIASLAKGVAAHGGALAEVTVLAYPDHVRSFEGQYILGCAEGDEAFWKGIFQSIGTFVSRIGDVGDASRGDLAFAITFVFNITASAFTAAMATKLNVPQEIIHHQLTANPAIAVTGAGELLPQMFARKYEESLASVDTVAMALEMGLPYAQRLGIPTKIIEGFVELYVEASRRGMGSKDVASVYEILLDPHVKPA
jgi:3-hydroxyisobutyrate dehydrogenase-like beta-hydroxyacid dehydrogenase